MSNIKNNKIVFATGIYPPDLGGPATYVKYLSKEFIHAGFDIEVVTYSKNVNKTDNVSTVTAKNFLVKYFLFFKLLLRSNAKAVYAHDILNSGIPTAFLKIFRPSTFVMLRVSGDTLWEKAFNDGWTKATLSEYYEQPKSLKEKIYILFYKFVFSKADKIIFTTNWLGDIFKKEFNIPVGKIEIIKNPFPVINSNLNILTNDKKIVYAGRLTKIKNLNVLIDAMKQFKDYELEIIGDGPEKDDLIKKIKEEKLANVEIVPPFKHEKILEEIAKSKFVVIPSISDVSPNLALEAVSLGKPVVLTKNTGFVDDYEFVYFNPKSNSELVEKIVYMFNEVNYNKEIEKINKIYKNRNWKDVMDEHRALL